MTYADPGIRPAPVDIDADTDWEMMTPVERGNAEQRFNAFMDIQLNGPVLVGGPPVVRGDPPIPVHWKPEQRNNAAIFNWFHEHHCRERRYDLETSQGPVGRLLQNHPLAREGVSILHEQIYERLPFAERMVNWGKEFAIGGAVVRGARALAPVAMSILNITGTTASFGASMLAGAAAGSLMGFRRAGERFITQNFNARKLLDDLDVENLVNAHGSYRSQIFLNARTRANRDPNYSPERITAGYELPGDYYAKVAKASAYIREVCDADLLRGDYRTKDLLMKRHAYLLSILEERAFFEQYSRQARESRARDHNSGARHGNEEASMFTDLVQFRLDGSWVDRFNVGVSAEAKKMVRDQQALARKASWKGCWKGAIVGLIGGTLAQGVKELFHHFYGHVGDHTVVDKPGFDKLKRVLGFGGGNESAHAAMDHAVNNEPDFAKVMQNLEALKHHTASTGIDISQVNPNGIDWDSLTPQQWDELQEQTRLMSETSKLLLKHGLPSLDHYTLPDGSNGLLDALTKVGDPVLGEHGEIIGFDAVDWQHLDPIHQGMANHSVYNLLSYWDHVPDAEKLRGMTLDQWHDHLRALTPDVQSNIDAFTQSHDAYIADIKARFPDWWQHVPDVSHIEGDAGAVAAAMQGAPAAVLWNVGETAGTEVAAAGGYLTGELQGRKEGTTTFDNNPLPITDKMWEDQHKRKPANGDVWEISHGAIDADGHSLFLRPGVRIPPGLQINAVISNASDDDPYVTVTILPPYPAKWNGKHNFTVSKREMHRSPGFNYLMNEAEYSAKQEREQTEKDRLAAEEAERMTKPVPQELRGTDQDWLLLKHWNETINIWNRLHPNIASAETYFRNSQAAGDIIDVRVKPEVVEGENVGACILPATATDPVTGAELTINGNGTAPVKTKFLDYKNAIMKDPRNVEATVKARVTSVMVAGGKLNVAIDIA